MLTRTSNPIRNPIRNPQSAIRNIVRLAVALVPCVVILSLAHGYARPAEPRGLDFYFIDVEGGAATLIVTPAGESILIDSGNPGDRDPGRIAAMAREAGLSQINHYITTHWHSDHFGGAWPLSKLIPIRHAYGHRIPDPLSDDISADLITAWRGVTADPIFLTAGDSVKLQGSRGSADPRLRILAADGRVEGEKQDAGPITKCDDGDEAGPEDKTDNARSLVMLLSFGRFDFFAGGDLTWNIEHKLTCPKKLAPRVDVFLADHHGIDASNNPTLVAALSPEVAIVNNGARKGAEPKTMTLLLKQVGDIGVFQLHKNVREDAVNTDPARIANEPEQCAGARLQLHVDPDGEHYSVEVPSRSTVRHFDSH
jgi:beta-lactamase superfamily II metal-dependent hydrolase